MRRLAAGFCLRGYLSSLPQGNSLPATVWVARHRTIVLLLWLHAVGLAGFAVFMGQSVAHSLSESGAIAVCALLATVGSLNHRLRSAAASLGLVMASAVLVHLSGGYIEMHFHFFVVLGVLALYQDWAPFLLAIIFVVLHHGIGGVLDPSAVYNHPAAWARPWTWAGIHGVFVLGASCASLVAWRMNETVQGRLRESHSVLERQALELKTRNAELDTFVYSVSHDLKAPLVTLQGMAGLLREDYAEQLGESGAHYLRRLEANVEQMERLITDLLALSRIGREARPREAVNLAELVDGLLVDSAGMVQSRGAKITVRDPIVLRGIRTQIEQVFSNLISNAVKYAGDVEPVIDIGAAPRGEFIECYVKDNGIGIDPAYHEKIFETFQRLKEIEADGTGVGLAIVKKIVEGAGGRVWVESAPGQGATFRFTWPAWPPG